MRYRLQKRIFLIILFLCVSGCGLLPQEEEFPAAPVIQSYKAQEYKQTLVMRGDLVLNKTVRLRYMPVKREALSFSLGGEYIEAIYVSKGQQVQKGDLLMELSYDNLAEEIAQQEYRLQVLKLKKEHAQEKWELEQNGHGKRLSELQTELQEVRRQIELLKVWEAQQESPEEWTDKAGKMEERPTSSEMTELLRQEEALMEERRSIIDEGLELQLQELEDSIYIEDLRLQELQQSMNQHQLRAGMDGSVTYVRDVKEGQRSVEGEIMITLVDMSTTAFIVEGDDAKYFPVGTEAVIVHGSTEMPAVSVEASELGFDRAENGEKQAAYLRLLEPDPTLEDGDSGSIQLVTDERRDVLYVNKKAIKSAGSKTYVYMLNEEGLKVMREVTTGLECGNDIEITSGLEEGDSVVVE